MTVMVPRIYNLRKIETVYVKFLEALTSSNFSGEIEDRYAARLLVATDNSVYQRMPQAVLFPKSKEDVVEIFKLASRSEFKSVKFAPRGGGTGTNGQSLTDGIVIDMSRHMKKVWDFNPQERSIYVQPGVIKDELNELTVYLFTCHHWRHALKRCCRSRIISLWSYLRAYFRGGCCS